MNKLSQRLQARHANMIALGGSLGTGIFLTSGYSIYAGGPGGALFAYIIMSMIVYFLMTSLGELSSYRPSAGTFCDYSTMYVGKSFGFAMGYNYWLNWAITIATEIAAAAIIMSYWFPAVDSIIFSSIFFATIFLFNIFSVRVYGEMEYWLSMMKVTVIIVFIILALVAVKHTPHLGTQNWHIGDAPFHNGFLGFLTVFLFAGFSFQGSELVGVASEEMVNARVTVARSIKRVFWRLCLFYILSIGLIGLLLPYTDPNLVNQNSVEMSPFTLVFKQYLTHYAADFINFVILIAILSAGNASMYSATRILWYLGKAKQAPTVFQKVNRHGVPMLALILTAAIGSLVFLSSYIGNGVLFTYLVQISSLSGFIAWFGIAYSHFEFRRKYLPSHGGTSALLYKAKFYPYAQIISMLFLVFIVGAQFITLGSASRNIFQIMTIYASVILFALFYLGHKIFARK